MKKLTKLLLPSISIMLVAIMALTGATFAWFTDGNNATFGTIDADVRSAEGILISWDAVSWKSELLFDETYTAITTNTNFDAADFKFEPCSTTPSTISNGAFTFYTADVKNEKLNSTSAATGGYVKFDVYINLVQDETIGVYGITVNAKNDILGDDGETVTGQKDSIGLASRVAFVYQGNDATKSESAVKALNGGTADNCFIYEPHNTTHTIDGKAYNASFGYEKNASADGAFKYLGVCGIIAATDNAKVDTALANKLELVNTVKQVPTSADVVFGENDIKFDMKAGYNKLTVYVWVEGQDADCLNDLSGTNLTVTFGLSKGAVQTQAPSETTETPGA